MGNLAFGTNKYDGKNNWKAEMGKFTDLDALDIEGHKLSLSSFEGNVLLITNVACKCGYTKGSYDAMQELSVKYYEAGLRVLCFPCNQFLSQEPWTEKEIKEWVTGQWPKLQPQMFGKIEVNGDNTHKVYKYLKTVFPGDINWNFATKFVVGRNGLAVARFDKNQTWQEIEKCIQKELNGNATQNEQNANDAAEAVEEKGKEDKDQAKVKEQEQEEQKKDAQATEENAPFDGKVYVETAIAEGQVVMISKSFCPFCKTAHEVLSKYTKDVIKKEIDLECNEEQMAAVQSYCKQLTGASSVPRVFINKKCIGGCDDTQALDKEGKLKALIEEEN